MMKELLFAVISNVNRQPSAALKKGMTGDKKVTTN